MPNFLSYSEKLQERVMCSPVIFSSSKFTVQNAERNQLSSEYAYCSFMAG